MKKNLLRAIGLLGMILFVPMMVMTFMDSYTVERAAKSFLERKLKSDLNKKIDSIELPKSQLLEKLLGAKAEALNKNADAKLTEYKQMLKNGLPAMMAEQFTQLSDPDCECRKKWKGRFTEIIDFEIASTENTKEKIANFLQAKYMETVERLTMDVRIFLGINALAFSVLFAASFLKPKATDHLFLPAVLLVLSTFICSYFYLFEQNWFYTIIYNEYTGFGYSAYLIGVFVILSDIVLNKAKMTTQIINTSANALGSAVHLSPC